jgi:hypothetical protein
LDRDATGLRSPPLGRSTYYITSLICICGLMMIGAVVARSADAADPMKIAGPNACAECHKQEAAAWKETHHFKTFRNMPRDGEAKKIADRMGIRRIKTESLCLGCHFTVQHKSDGPEPIAGISCESCHSAAKDWIKVHSGYSGKTANTETKTEEEARWKRAESEGMIRKASLYRLAKNCYSCHVVPHETLVNTGGHKAGSAFDLVAWSQGEVRHNTWYSKGKENVAASAARKRMLYLVGLGVELETALRAVGNATVRKPYAFLMAQRADKARKQLAKAAAAAPDVPEIAKIIEHAHKAGLKLNNKRSLTAAADAVSELLTRLTEVYDGSTMAGLDALIPPPESYKGTARAAATVN